MDSHRDKSFVFKSKKWKGEDRYFLLSSLRAQMFSDLHINMKQKLECLSR